MEGKEKREVWNKSFLGLINYSEWFNFKNSVHNSHLSRLSASESWVSEVSLLQTVPYPGDGGELGDGLIDKPHPPPGVLT